MNHSVPTGIVTSSASSSSKILGAELRSLRSARGLDLAAVVAALRIELGRPVPRSRIESLENGTALTINTAEVAALRKLYARRPEPENPLRGRPIAPVGHLVPVSTGWSLPSNATLDDALWAATRRGPLVTDPLVFGIVGSSSDRLAVAAVRVGGSTLTSPYDVLAGSSAGPAFWRSVARELPAGKNRASPTRKLTALLAGGDPRDVRADLERIAKHGDSSDELSAVALLSGAKPTPAHGLWNPLYDPDRSEAEAGADRLAALATTIAGAGGRRASAKALRNSLWSAPLSGGPVERLRSTMDSLGLETVSTNTVALTADGDRSLLWPAMGLLAQTVEARRLTCDEAELLTHERLGLRLLLVEGENAVAAWVGDTSSNKGLLVGFGTDEAFPLGLAVGGVGTDIALAAKWWIDLVLGGYAWNRRRRSGIADRLCDARFDRQLDAVVAGRRQPALPHFHKSHVRSYAERLGSEEAQSRAPKPIRRHLGLHDTWVRGYWTAGSAETVAIRTRLRTKSALADLAGIILRSGPIFHQASAVPDPDALVGLRERLPVGPG